jgi:hypothetical protein
LVALKTLNALKPRRACRARRTLRTRRACCARDTLFALNALNTLRPGNLPDINPFIFIYIPNPQIRVYVISIAL